MDDRTRPSQLEEMIVFCDGTVLYPSFVHFLYIVLTTISTSSANESRLMIGNLLLSYRYVHTVTKIG